MIIDCISDLHGFYPELEGGDLLIVAGDINGRDTLKEYTQFGEWLLSQKYKKKIFVAGNHDNKIQNGDYYFNHDWLGYLQDSGNEFDDFKIWGSPWTRRFDGMNPNCMAFTLSTDEELHEKWKLIPTGTDILVTHCPPKGILDSTSRKYRVGSESLANELARIKPKLHVFGHIHEAYGIVRANLGFVDCQGYPIFVNASHVNVDYKPVNKPMRVIL